MSSQIAKRVIEIFAGISEKNSLSMVAIAKPSAGLIPLKNLSVPYQTNIMPKNTRVIVSRFIIDPFNEYKKILKQTTLSFCNLDHIKIFIFSENLLCYDIDLFQNYNIVQKVLLVIFYL